MPWPCLPPKTSVLMDQKMVEMCAAAAYFGPPVYAPRRQHYDDDDGVIAYLYPPAAPQIRHAASTGSVSIGGVSLLIIIASDIRVCPTTWTAQVPSTFEGRV